MGGRLAAAVEDLVSPQQASPMRVLVTGHRGYIGSVLVPLLQARGHAVTGMDSDLYRRCTFSGRMPAVRSVDKDVRDAEVDDLAGFDAVIHLAGLSNDPLGDLDPALTDRINHQGTVRVAELAKRCGVRRFLFASSCSLYGASGGEFLDEGAPFNPVTPYGWSKVHAEQALAQLADADFSPTCLRAGTAYGLSPRIRFDLVANNLVAWAVASGKVMLKSDGTAWRPLVHVEDIAAAYVAVLEAPREAVHDQAFNVGSSSENYRVRDIAELVKAAVPGSTVDFLDRPSPDSRCYRVDCNRIARTLHGFKPQWTAARGVAQLHRSFVRAGLTVEDFEGPRFQRIAHIRHLLAQGVLDADLRVRRAARDGR